MIAQNLQCRKQCQQKSSLPAFASIYQQHAGYSGRNVHQRHQLPKMPCRYQNYKVGRKAPRYTSQNGYPIFYAHNLHQYEKAD